MPTQPIPFTGSNKNVDQAFLNGINYTCRNGVVDELGNLNRRPGQTLFVDLGTAAAVTGLFYSSKHNVTIAVSGAQIFSIASNGTATDITGTGIPQLGNLVTFADFGDILYAANGGKIISIPLTGGTTTFITDASAPVLVTHVAVLDRRLIANNLAFDARFEWSNVGDGSVWSGEFATAEAQNDKLLGLYVRDERVVLFGASTIQHFYNAGDTFRPEGQEFVERGVIAKYAPAFCRDRWIWLDEYKQLCMLNGRQAVSLPQQNSRGLTKFLQDLDLTDARGRYVVSAGRFYYLCLLPKAEKSFFYDIDKDEFYEASFWDELNAEDDLYRAFSSTYAFGKNWGQMLIGDSRSGQVFTFDTDSYTDNSEIIRTVLTSGYIDRGSSENRKSTSRISGRLKLQNVTPTIVPLITGTDSDMTGSNNWISVDFTEFDINSTVPNRMYMLGDGGNDYTYLSNKTVGGVKYKVSLKARLNAGASTEIRVGNVASANPDNYFTLTPTSTEQTFIGEFTALASGFFYIGLSSPGSSGVAFEIGDVFLEKSITDPLDALNMMFRWRNENTHTWSERSIKLYKESANQFRWATTSLGQYYMRQYEFVVTADTDFIMSAPQETFQVVG